MTNRADEVAASLVAQIQYRPGVELDLQAHIAATLRAYAEEASAHWKREAESGAAMLAAIHRGLGLGGTGGGVSAQDVLDRVDTYDAQARREEREACAKVMDHRVAAMKARYTAHVQNGVESTEGTWYRARWAEAEDGAATS